ncbi:MAG TPA: divalent-cation tolerance protein CutA [Caldithrix abyssi]|uniref:Divalent-cation tolerance protein CutA n=1 Tax=Caldithrix abyssi TaxID=187145 RepID=A0A7V5RNB5_CALAY|nr:divalent-cation tolerance protein CutA [Caldithrix abyssi]
MMDMILVHCTLPDRDTAQKIARAVLDEHLAACCTITQPVLSLYHWQGKVEQSEETLMLIKTVRRHFDALDALIRKMHPYEVPEIIAHKIDHASDAYGQWIESSVRET